ncbi:murein transglycosylase A [Albidovulum aquaemixtae]|nr:MltA domain-containing protein [Defluviimonas aquaemixtae]
MLRLSGWSDDDHEAALSAYASTADLLPDGWPRPDGDSARRFFERNFHLASPVPALVTGYFEPELDARSRPEGPFRYPLYAAPADLPDGKPWYSRAEIEEGGLLAGRELVWLASALDAFFAQVQGSVRVRLPGVRGCRFGYAGANGHAYRSIGEELVRREAIAETDISIGAIRDWCERHPDQVPALLRHNPSFVFFRKRDLPANSGPIGTLGRSVSAGRSIAVDPAYVPLGAPVWLETEAGGRLTVAQDTGSAIKGSGRADLFCGTGSDASDLAGSMRDSGRMFTFLPRQDAERTLR